MGWAWRSSESYGDKDEPSKKPDAESSDAKERGTPGGVDKSWWDMFEADERKSYSSGSSYADDDWRGYQGPSYSEYSYDKSIDDSDTRWYRKSSFKYSGYKDYSPSSLFRSAFYSSKSSFYTVTSAENEAKNKAIRALRTLSRNANTVCDKSAKISYTVQYGAGAESNAFEDTLIDGKSVKAIYVSPDSIVNAKTTEDEDAAVDALTGFVLLRVQIAQDFDKETIRGINSVTLRSLPTRLIKVFGEKDLPAAGAVAEEHVDDCLAGMLSKGILTRLARRNVVKDWGGFAPYFVRHAKNFAKVREKLETAGLSVESIVGKLTYNMVDDENLFELDKELDEIVTKHLGAEVAQEQILDTCRALMADLRKYVRKNTPAEESAAGPIEDALKNFLEEFMNAQAESLAERQKEKDVAEKALTEMGQAMNEQFLAARQENDAHPFNAEKDNEFDEELTLLTSMEQVVASAKTSIKELEMKTKEFQTALDNKLGQMHLDYIKTQSDYVQIQIANRMEHFRYIREEMRKRGAKDEFTPADYTPANTGDLLENLEAEKKALATLMEEYQRVIKESLAKLREEMLKTMAPVAEHNKVAHEAAKENREKLEEHIKNMREVIEAGGQKDNPVFNDMLNAMDRMNARARDQIECAAANAKNTENSIANTRTAKGLRTEYQKARNMMTTTRFNYDMRTDSWQYEFENAAVAQFAQTGIRQMNRLDSRSSNFHAVEKALNDANWAPPAIRQFFAATEASAGNLEASAIRELNNEMFEQIKKLFEKGDGGGHVPSEEDSIGKEHKDKLDKLRGMAESLNMSVDELLQMYHESNSTIASTLANTGKEIGKKIRELLPLFEQINPIDNELFGELIKVTTTVLEDATAQVNDEARNDPEEEFVAYLSHSEAKPIVRVVRPKADRYARETAQRSRTEQRNIIARIREALQFHNNKRTGDIYGVRSGDLDEGGLHKLGYDCEHIWSQKTITQLPDVAVGILVDQSGSMSCIGKIEQAREMCIALAEAVKKIPGIHLHIYGHTANMRGLSDLTLYEHYSSTSDTAASTANLDVLGGIDAHSNNYDGYAIKEAAKLLAKDPAKRKYLFVISDGLPHGEGYAGKDAEKHVASVCQFVRERLKIATYAFAVGVPTSGQSKFVEQYGRDNVVFLTTVRACLPQITRFLRNSLQKEKTLVEI